MTPDYMDTECQTLIARIQRAFSSAPERPSLSLRAGDALDDHLEPPGYDPVIDAPSFEYIDSYAAGIAFLDAASWNHYTPRLLVALVERLDDNRSTGLGNFLELLVPPHKNASRTGWMTPDEASVVVDVLDLLAFHPDSAWKEEATKSLEDYWAPRPNYP
jgi:hypothetical protein